MPPLKKGAGAEGDGGLALRAKGKSALVPLWLSTAEWLTKEEVEKCAPEPAPRAHRNNDSAVISRRRRACSTRRARS